MVIIKVYKQYMHACISACESYLYGIKTFTVNLAPSMIGCNLTFDRYSIAMIDKACIPQCSNKLLLQMNDKLLG